MAFGQRRRGILGLGKGVGGRGGVKAVTLLPENKYTMPESVSVVQTRSNCSKNKTTILASNETVIIPKIVILKTRIPFDLDRQPDQQLIVLISVK